MAAGHDRPPVALAQLGPPVDLRRRFAVDRARLLALLRSLAPDAWTAPTPCAPWTVHDVACHLLGDDLGRISRTRDRWEPLVPGPGEPFPRFIDRINDEWVTAARRCSPAVLVALLEWAGAESATAWLARDLHHPADGVSWAGLVEGPVWLDAARDVTEYWIHEQHVREAVGAPTTEDPEDLVPGLDVLARGLPSALAGCAASPGTAVGVVATHGGRPVATWWLQRRDGGWWLGGEPAGPGHGAATVVTVDGGHLWRRWTRHPAGSPARAEVAGDADLAAAVLDHVAIIRS